MSTKKDRIGEITSSKSDHISEEIKMNFQERMAADAKVVEKHEQEIRDRIEISNFYDRHPEVLDCMANTALIRRYLADADVSEENLEAAYAHTQLYQQLAKQTPQEDRAKVEARILELMKGGTSAPGLASCQAAFRFKSLEELKGKRDELERIADLRSKTPEELRAIVRSRDATLPELPSEISGFQIRNMLDASQLRHLIKRYGADAVTRRANEEGKNQ